MRFLVDECAGPAVTRWLEEQGHDVFSIYEHSAGMSDAMVMQTAFEQDRIPITNDKDFGDLIFRERRAHKGVVLMRLDDERSSQKIEVLRRLLTHHGDDLTGRFAVVTETKLRFARIV